MADLRVYALPLGTLLYRKGDDGLTGRFGGCLGYGKAYRLRLYPTVVT